MKRVQPRGWRDDLMIRFRGVRFHGAISTGWSPQRDLDNAISRCDLYGAISRLDLVGASSMARLGLGWWFKLDNASPISLSLVSLRALSLSLSLSTRLSSEIICSENRSVKYFSSQSHKTHGQLKLFSRKFYFSCTTKHAVRCKIISWNGFTPKQT